MKHSNRNDSRVVLDSAWRDSGGTHCAQNAQRASKWRRALVALGLAPTRLHQFRNLRSAMFYDALCTIDCKD